MSRVGRSHSAGFTLVELMVALTGGLFVTMAVFVLSKQATNLYQSEARMSTATLGSIVGFERLRADIERAGFLTTPNVTRDPKVCGVPDAQWPAGASGQFLRHLSSIWIEPSPSTTALSQLTANGITPDQITMAGSYASADQFPTGPIFDDGANNKVMLQAGSAPMVRLGYAAAAGATEQRALLLSVFGIGRILRIVDTAGREQYGTIVDVETSPAPALLVHKTAPPILYRGASNQLKCGVQGVGDKSLVNVVNLIRYSLQNMSASTRYAALFPTNAPPTDQGRTELVREELDATGTPIKVAGVEIPEVVSEFAVDLSFAVTVSQVVTSGSGSQMETLTMLAQADRTNWVGPGWAGDTAAAAAASRGPQLVRAVRARLSVRSREADRLANVQTFGDGGTAPVMGGLYRFRVPAAAGPAYARVRTVQADVALRSQRSATWL